MFYFMKRFNVTGLCIPEEDYMVDISGKITQIRKFVDNRSYFTINRARQYGKTTTFNELRKELKDEYLVIKISFEGIGDTPFESAENFCETFMRLIQYSLEYTDVEEDYISEWFDKDATTFKLLSRHIAYTIMSWRFPALYS